MKLSAAVLSLFAAGSWAAPRSEPRQFNVLALSNGTAINYKILGATQNALVLNLPDHRVDSQCVDGQPHGPATFYIQDSELLLYTPKEDPQQQAVLVDRSGMGLGIIQYYNRTDNTPLGGRLETKGWALDEDNNLVFNGIGLTACRASDADPTYYVRLDLGIQSPHGYKDCTPFTARAVAATRPVPCRYSTH
ncbi:hypothetical protein VTH06DRAFT_4915 [Thermothelomyces fergusii]